MSEASASAREAARLGRVEQLKKLAKYEKGETVSYTFGAGPEMKISAAEFAAPKKR